MAARTKGVFYIKQVITYSFGKVRIKRLYYNPFYVTYRGMGAAKEQRLFTGKKLGFGCEGIRSKSLVKL